MRRPEDPRPGRPRRATLLAAARRLLLAAPRRGLAAAQRLAGATARPAPTWRRAAREASDVRSLRDALQRFADAPTELLVGPEPPDLPLSGWRFDWLRRYRVPVLWLAAAATFLPTVEYMFDNHRIADFLVPPLAVLVVLPLGLAGRTPLRAWRLQMLVAAAVVVVAPPLSREGPPWPPPVILVAIYVIYAVAVRVGLHLLVGIWLVTGATVVFSFVATGARATTSGEVYATLALLTVGFAYCYLIGTRRRLQHELVEGRQQQEEEQARSALLEERARIARELHDIVAHHMSVIAVRTETAPFRIPELPEAAKDDLAETSAIAREALTEMRRLLGVLRGADASVEHAPQPGMGGLDALLAAVRGAGLAVDLRVVGAARPLPSGVELSAYRIIQEALSNTLRHAPGASATVEVGYEPDRLWLRVRNEAPPGRPDHARPAQPGQGIIGMRERAAMLGGHLATGATPQGGYLVEAVLPLDGRDHATEPR
ncbi:MAG TPA: sensor histidine kinase [Actinomycetes bacterium]